MFDRVWIFACLVGYGISQNISRTVIFIHRETIIGENLFIRGGIAEENRPGCEADVETDPCAISIKSHLLGTTETYDSYNAWRINDLHLDWYGPEVGQGSYDAMEASGTPLHYSSDDPYDVNYQELNTYGSAYWMIDMDMDCDETENGWFEFKYYIDVTGWESDIDQDTYCTGDIGGSSVLSGVNHSGMCGYINVFEGDEGSCIIDNFPE